MKWAVLMLGFRWKPRIPEKHWRPLISPDGRALSGWEWRQRSLRHCLINLRSPVVWAPQVNMFWRLDEVIEAAIAYEIEREEAMQEMWRQRYLYRPFEPS